MSQPDNIKTSNISYPENILFALRETEDEFLKEIKSLAAIKYYQNKMLSLGKAAELADMTKYSFIQMLGQNNVPVLDLDEYELIRDIENA